MTTATFERTITPAYETIGKRQRLTGFIGQLTDEAGVVLHSMEYSTNGQAEMALNALVFDLLMDAADRGLVDTLPELAA